MKIKTTIRTFDYVKKYLAVVLVLVWIVCALSIEGPLVEWLGAALALIVAFFYMYRPAIIIWIIHNSHQPGLMYAVLDKMRYTEKMNISLTDRMLDEIYKPIIPTKEFLGNNDLKTHYPFLDFLNNGLVYDKATIPWTDVIDWNLIIPKRDPTGFTLTYYNEKRDIQQLDIPLSGIDTIDALLLLTHFKGKYGQQPH